MDVRMLGVVIATSAMLMLGMLMADMHPADDEAFVDGPLGPAMIQPPDLSKPVDVNEP